MLSSIIDKLFDNSLTLISKRTFTDKYLNFNFKMFCNSIVIVEDKK